MNTHAVAAPRAPYHHGDLRRALMEAASAMAAEERGWSFSLREVARRAGVSHNAPARHFAEKRDLLAGLAVQGYETLTTRMRDASSGLRPTAAMEAIGIAYVEYAVENSGHYRLMFGPELRAKGGELPSMVAESALQAKAVLTDVIRTGVGAGDFQCAPGDGPGLNMAVLSAWAIVHGLAMLLIDGIADDAIRPTALVAENVTRALLRGLCST